MRRAGPRLNFLVGFMVGAGIGVAAAALLLKVGAGRELEILRGEHRAYADALRYVRNHYPHPVRHLKPGELEIRLTPWLIRYIDGVLGDEAGA